MKRLVSLLAALFLLAVHCARGLFPQRDGLEIDLTRSWSGLQAVPECGFPMENCWIFTRIHG